MSFNNSKAVFLLISCLNISFFSTGFANEKTPVSNAEETFENAWNNPEYTHYKLNDVNINETLAKSYETPSPLHFTREMLWDVESKKAWDPKTYIAYVVRDGKSWGKKAYANGDETFVRSSEQKQWLDSNVYETVFEEVYLNHKDQRVTFLGVNSLISSSGECLKIQNKQPLFHVQHSVEGSEDNPINVWRIVLLTNGKDQKLIDRFDTLNKSRMLPGFVEIYIEKDLKIPLKKKTN